MKKLGIAMMTVGIMMVGWFGYQYWSSMQSVTKLDGDVVKQTNNSTPLSADGSPVDPEKPDASDSGSNSLLESGGTADNDADTPEVDVTGGEDIAQLVIPSIDLSFDVFWGTGKEALAKGVGMYDSQFTAPPDSGGHTVLSGHRESVFQPVGDLEDGDSIYVNYQGEDYEYEINKTWITNAEDKSVIVEKEDPTLTLTTCYPFQYIGSAPDRYIVEADLVQRGDLLKLD